MQADNHDQRNAGQPKNDVACHGNLLRFNCCSLALEVWSNPAIDPLTFLPANE
jgi:hypothetical protein